MNELTTLIFIGILNILLIISLVGVMDQVNDSEWCMINSIVSNSSNPNDYYMETRDGVKYCCGNTGQYGYERDEGTLTYFLMGKNGYYTKTRCEKVKK